MKKLLFIVTLFLFVACDDGDIEEKYTFHQEGLKVAVDATISGVDSWPDGYSVTLSGFVNETNSKDDIAEYSEISKQIISDGNGKIHVTLGGISQTVNYLEITVLNRIRQRVLTICQKKLTDEEKNSTDTIRWDAGEVRAGMYSFIQDNYFTPKCSKCHGQSADKAAAGLFLTEGKSYNAIVGVQSSKRSDFNIVTPGDTARSSIHKILRGEYPEVKHNHTDKLDLESDKDWIDQWILNGAKAD